MKKLLRVTALLMFSTITQGMNNEGDTKSGPVIPLIYLPIFFKVHMEAHNYAGAMNIVTLSHMPVSFFERHCDTPLHCAVLGKNKKAASQFLRFINSPNHVGATPLHYAALIGDESMTTFLLSHNANPTLHDDDSNTPLQIATQFARTPVISLLQQALSEHRKNS